MGRKLQQRTHEEIPLLGEPACAGMDTELFFIGEQNTAKIAKAVCVGCGVLEACREWAIANEEFGVWGGLTEYERRAIRKRRAKVAV